VIAVLRAGERARTQADGSTSWHCFSSGAHYDPANVSFGPVIACDEHLLEPGAGFARHGHVGVELLSWVLDGALRHTDDAGREHTVRPGTLQYQRAGTGIAHAEANASDTAPLRFVQLWLLCDDGAADYALAAPPLQLRGGRCAVLSGAGRLGPGATFAFVARGEFRVCDETLAAGDSARVPAGAWDVEGAGELLTLTVPASTQ
jgi:hypothetical protein